MRVRGFVQVREGALDTGFLRNGRSYLFERLRDTGSMAVYTAFRSTHHTISGDPVGRTTVPSSDLVTYLVDLMKVDPGLLADRIGTALDYSYRSGGDPDAPVAIAARLNLDRVVPASLVSRLPPGYGYLDFDDGRPVQRPHGPLVVPSAPSLDGIVRQA